MDTGLVVLLIIPCFFFACVIGYYIWRYFNNKKWERIELLNERVDITRDNAYIDQNGYLRWRSNERLCHRDIAWNAGVRGNDKFGNSDIHHVDRNKFNCNPGNLECLTRAEHQEEHGQVIYESGRKYIRLCRVGKIYRETGKAIMVARRWIPKSQTIYRDGYVYITEWIARQKGF
jgi:hypothetical protein